MRDEFFEKGRFSDWPVYDMHGHMGPFFGAHFCVTEADEMVRLMDRAGVALLAFCGHAALLAPEIGNGVNIEAARRFPGRLRAYCGINPNYPETARRNVETFDDYSDAYIGFKFLADYHGLPISHAHYQPAWELADARGLIVLSHTWGGSPQDGPEQVRLCAERYPNARLLLGHSIHGDWNSAIRLANDFPNVFLELCAVLDERGILERFVAEAGSDKLIFGTDFPWFDHHYYIGAILGADITDEDRRRILCENAESLLGAPG